MSSPISDPPQLISMFSLPLLNLSLLLGIKVEEVKVSGLNGS